MNVRALLPVFALFVSPAVHSQTQHSTHGPWTVWTYQDLMDDTRMTFTESLASESTESDQPAEYVVIRCNTPANGAAFLDFFITMDRIIYHPSESGDPIAVDFRVGDQSVERLTFYAGDEEGLTLFYYDPLDPGATARLIYRILVAPHFTVRVDLSYAGNTVARWSTVGLDQAIRPPRTGLWLARTSPSATNSANT